MPLVVDEKNTIADTEAARLGFVSLHTADPGTTGANEAVGGSPAYVRIPLVFAAAVAGSAGAAEVTIDVPAGNYTHGGTWDSLIDGVFRGGNLLRQPQNLTVQDQVKVTVTVPVTVS